MFIVIIKLIQRAYYPTYPNESVYNAVVLQNIMYHGGDPDCLPGAFISNDLVKILNTLASASLLFAMGLASDIDMIKKTFKVKTHTVLSPTEVQLLNACV